MNKILPYTREEFDSLVEEMVSATEALENAMADIYSGSLIDKKAFIEAIMGLRNAVFKEAISILQHLLNESVSADMESMISKKEYLVKLTDSFIEKENPYFILHIVKASDDSTINYIPITKSLLFA